MKRCKTKKSLKTFILMEDRVVKIHRKKGNGILRRQIWADFRGRVTRYNLTYINYRIFMGDNGRVLGYDNAHGYHHRHYLGKVEPIDFIDIETLEKRFTEEFEVIHEEAKRLLH